MNKQAILEQWCLCGVNRSVMKCAGSCDVTLPGVRGVRLCHTHLMPDIQLASGK